MRSILVRGLTLFLAVRPVAIGRSGSYVMFISFADYRKMLTAIWCISARQSIVFFPALAHSSPLSASCLSSHAKTSPSPQPTSKLPPTTTPRRQAQPPRPSRPPQLRPPLLPLLRPPRQSVPLRRIKVRSHQGRLGPLAALRHCACRREWRLGSWAPFCCGNRRRLTRLIHSSHNFFSMCSRRGGGLYID